MGFSVFFWLSRALRFGCWGSRGIGGLRFRVRSFVLGPWMVPLGFLLLDLFNGFEFLVSVTSKSCTLRHEPDDT